MSAKPQPTKPPHKNPATKPKTQPQPQKGGAKNPATKPPLAKQRITKPKTRGRKPMAKGTHPADICAHIAQGKSLAAYCRDSNVGYTTVMKWLDEDDKFAHDYVRARQDAADADADTVTDIREKVMRGEITPEVARVAIDAAKWTAGKRAPKKYGDRLIQDIEIEAGPKLLESTRERALAIVSALDRNRPSSVQLIEINGADS